MVLRWQLSTHIHGTVTKKTDWKLESLRNISDRDVYKRSFYFLRRVWWCLSHYHRTLHLRCSVEAIKGLDHAISTAVMAMKLQRMPKLFLKKVDTSFSHDNMLWYVYSRTCNSKRNWKNAYSIMSYTNTCIRIHGTSAQQLCPTIVIQNWEWESQGTLLVPSI